MRHGGSGDSFQVTDAVLRKQGPGKPIPEGLRIQMERAMGTDFSAVRVHVGPQAQSIGAIAFTTGNDLFFAPGQYQPDSAAGRELIGHELAHVVQQRQGRVPNPFGGGVAVVQNRALEAEADAMARRALAYRPPAQHASALQPRLASPPRRATLQASMGPCPYCPNALCQNGSVCKNTNRSKYGTFEYGGKVREQQRLSAGHKKKVSGETHQAEHPFGYAVLAGDISGERGKGAQLRQVEQTAPAYQEHHRSHRDHIGTGTSNSPGVSGINSHQYREWTGQALTDHNPDIAMAINQMDYAHMDRSGADPTELRQSDDSFNMMARNMGQIPFGQGGVVTHLPAPTDEQRMEMLIVRWTVSNRRHPTPYEVWDLCCQNGLQAAWHARFDNP